MWSISEKIEIACMPLFNGSLKIADPKQPTRRERDDQDDLTDVPVSKSQKFDDGDDHLILT